MTLALVFSLGLTAMAAQDQTVTVTNIISGVTQLEIYQIASYTYVDKEGANAVSINSIYKDAFVAAINASGLTDAATITAASSDTDIMLWITNNAATDNTDFAKALAAGLKAVAADAATPAYATSGVINANSYTFAVDSGYYLVLDVTPTSEDYTYASTVMLQPTEPNATVALKSSYDRLIEKDIVEHDDSYNIGDVVDFAVTATVPNKGDTTFEYVVTDTMTAGLTLVDGSVKVTVDGVELDAADLANVYAVAGQVQTLIFTQANIKAGDTIIFTYSATLNAQAENIEGNAVFDRYGTTIYNGTTVEVYTFDLQVNKVNEAGEALEGVEFKLIKTPSTGSEETGDYIPAKYYTFAKGTDGIYRLSATGAETLTTDADGKISVHGLDEGTYLLEEIATLKGYNLLAEPVEVVIARDKDEGGGMIFLTAQEVINYTGIELPGTGGIGTTLFPIIGAIIILGAGVILFLNRKRVFGK